MKQATEDLINTIYDTLFRNEQHPQFNIDDVDDQWVDAGKGVIEITMVDGCVYRVTVQKVFAPVPKDDDLDEITFCDGSWQ